MIVASRGCMIKSSARGRVRFATSRHKPESRALRFVISGANRYYITSTSPTFLPALPGFGGSDRCLRRIRGGAATRWSHPLC